MSAYDGTTGTYKGEQVCCPVNGFGCPYFNRGLCLMEDGDPMEDCDDFASIFESWEEWEALE